MMAPRARKPKDNPQYRSNLNHETRTTVKLSSLAQKRRAWTREGEKRVDRAKERAVFAYPTVIRNFVAAVNKMAEASEVAVFDLRTVHDHFDRALIDDDDINIRAYLDAYNELYKFFQLMGSVFSFVSSDLKHKIDMLDGLVKNDEQSYKTIKSMIGYEKENNLFEKSVYGNGARTLLRLHRGLDFIREFLRQLGELADSEKASNCCQDAYGKTLAKHHSWIIRKAVVVAMYSMPTREQLFKKVCGDNVQKNLDVLPKMLEITANVFDRTHDLYELHELHGLP